MVSRTQRRRTWSYRSALIAACVTGAFTLPGLAQAAPTPEEIARAQAAEEAAKMSVAQIEVRLAAVTAQANSAVQNAQIAAEELNAAKLALEAATQTAEQAQADADKAQADFEEGKKDIASVAQAAYRDGGSALDSLAPYLDADGLRTVETKRASLETFSSTADKKMQRVAALEQVADVMKGAADSALEAQQAATTEVEARTNAAQSAAESALTLQQTTAAQRQVYVEELARKQNTTVELIEQREAALAAERQAAAEAAAKAAAEAEAARRAAESAYTPAPPTYVPPAQPYVPPASSSGGAAGAIAAAKSYLGVPYVWGGESYSGVDCSGLTTLAWRSVGVSLPHYSKSQYDYGTKVPLNSMQPGDLIFWSSNGAQSGIYHVAIYLGDGQMIEAPTFGLTVRITSVYSWGSIMPYAVRL